MYESHLHVMIHVNINSKHVHVTCLSLKHKPIRYCMASNFGEREKILAN